MKIFGIGTDIVNIKRMQKTLKINNDNFKKRIFINLSALKEFSPKTKLFTVKKKRIPHLFTLRDLLLKKP